MTNLEAYKALFSKYSNSISDGNAITDLELSGIDPNDVYDVNNNCALYASLLSRMSGNSNDISSESEGGYSVTYDKGDKMRYLYSIAQDSKCSDLMKRYNPAPKITDKSYLW